MTDRMVILSEEDLGILVQLTKAAEGTWSTGHLHRLLAEALFRPAAGTSRAGSIRIQLSGRSGPMREILMPAARGTVYTEFFTDTIYVEGVAVSAD
jgi:hypothetical protein